jgi:predicted Fe-Mo cluster-binding NifX family protein
MTTTAITPRTRTGCPTVWCLDPERPVRHDLGSLLIAVASDGGDSVDRDFEDADSFLLYEKTAHNTHYIGRQPCPLSTPAQGAVERAALLAGCDRVLCTGVSDNARRVLAGFGIQCDLACAGATIADAVFVA